LRGLTGENQAGSASNGPRYRSITPWTHSVLTADRRIYERAGFKLVAKKEHTMSSERQGKRGSSIWGNNRGSELLAGIQRSGAGPR
jgi:hypothetical protein